MAGQVAGDLVAPGGPVDLELGQGSLCHAATCRGRVASPLGVAATRDRARSWHLGASREVAPASREVC
jgi:hypothetical protein